MLERDERHFGAGLDLLDGPRVAVGVAEAEERAAVALVEDLDLAGLDAAIEQLLAGGRASATTSCRPRIDPGVISRCAGRSPMTIEQPDPRGVSWTTCMCSFVVS